MHKFKRYILGKKHINLEREAGLNNDSPRISEYFPTVKRKFHSIILCSNLICMNEFLPRHGQTQLYFVGQEHSPQRFLNVFPVRLIRKSAQPRADVQPFGLRTLNFALACAATLMRSSGRSVTTAALVYGWACALHSRTSYIVMVTK